METEAASLPAATGDHDISRVGDRGSARSFDCTFCKRGFSNAQALGGHMNMHRKDKAKLKPPPTSRCFRSFPFDVSGSSKQGQAAGYGGGAIGSRWCSPPAAPLSLFAERAAWGNDGGGGRSGQIGEERRGLEAEVDLELRLGRSSETCLLSLLQERN